MNRGTMGVNSLPKTVTRQRRACDFWTQALLRMSPSWVRFLVHNIGLVQYRWTGLDLLTVDRLKLQDWKIVNFSKYSLSCYTYVFHRCRFVLSFSVLAFSVAPPCTPTCTTCNTGFLGPTRVCFPNGITIDLSVFVHVGLTGVRHTQTMPRHDICSNSPHFITCMRCRLMMIQNCYDISIRLTIGWTV